MGWCRPWSSSNGTESVHMERYKNDYHVDSSELCYLSASLLAQVFVRQYIQEQSVLCTLWCRRSFIRRRYLRQIGIEIHLFHCFHPGPLWWAWNLVHRIYKSERTWSNPWRRKLLHLQNASSDLSCQIWCSHWISLLILCQFLR